MVRWRSQKLLGKPFADQMHQIVLEIGEDVWTRQELVEHLRCGHFRAAQILSVAVREFQPKNLRELMQRINIYDLFALKGVGVTTAYVWLCALDARGSDPVRWLQTEPKEQRITLPTYKLRTVKYAEEEEEKQRAKVTPLRKRA